MSRTKGVLSFSGNFEPELSAPFDARMTVQLKSDLSSSTVWESLSGEIYAYAGMLTVVYGDTEDNNGLYRLINLPVTTESNWVKVDKTLSELGTYSQTEIDTNFATKIELSSKADFDTVYTKTEIDSKISSVYKFKGSVASASALPATNLVVGDVYNVTDTGANYAWDGTYWDKLSETIDLSGYAETNNVYSKTEADSKFVTPESLDSVALYWKGEFIASSNYQVNDIVYYSGSSYLCYNEYNASEMSVPSFSFDYFSILAKKGDTGLQGTTGQTGTAATIEVGTVTTGAPGSDVTVINSGTNSTAVLDFSIPVGANGSDATVPNATTSVAGKVQLSNAIDSSSTTLASTTYATKLAYDRGSLGVTNAATAQSTASAALPKSGGTLTGGLTGTNGVFNTSVATPILILDGWTITVSS